MNKYSFLTLLISSSLLYGQVGVKRDDNSDNTIALDVNGTLGISQPGAANDAVNSISREGTPLYWNPGDKKIVTVNKNNNASENRKIKHQRYELRVAYENNEEWIKDLDLGIDGDLYEAFLLNYRLSRHFAKDETEDYDGFRDVVYIPISRVRARYSTSSNNYPNDDVKDMLGSNGTFQGMTNVKFRLLDGESGNIELVNPSYAGIITPRVFLKKSGSKWLLTADYPGVSPKIFDYWYYEGTRGRKNVSNRNAQANFKWYIDVLLIPKFLVKAIKGGDKIQGSVNNENATSDWVDSTIADTNYSELK